MPGRYKFTALDSLFGVEGSPVMQSIRETIARIAMSDLGVLIVGESGTEKEVLARRIHELSGRSSREFVHLNCCSFTEDLSGRALFGSEDLTLTGIEVRRGIVELANGGTIYFDQITELPPSVHTRICRAVENRQFRRVDGFEPVGVNVRVIASINRRSGDTMRYEEPGHTPYCNMCTIYINLPPLRERREDIPILIEQFMLEAKNLTVHHPAGITTEALDLFLSYDWPGNAQELYQAMEYALDACSDQFIRKNHLPEYMQRHDWKQTRLRANEPTLTWDS